MEAGNVRQSLEKRSKGAVKTCKRGREKKTEIETGVYVKAEKTKIAQNRNSFKSRRRRQIFVKKALKMFKRGRQKNV